MENIFRNIYIKIGQFNSTVLYFIKGLGYEFFFNFFLSAFLSLTLAMFCPAFVAVIFPIGLVATIELSFRGYIFKKALGEKPIIKEKSKDLIASIIGTGIGILLSYACISLGVTSIIWF